MTDTTEPKAKPNTAVEAAANLTVKESDTNPDWATIPAEMNVPKGRQVYFLRFRKEWTAAPSLGERQCVVWELSSGDKKIAISRAQGDTNRLADELTKQFIRVIDGQVADWTGAEGSGNVDSFWEHLGEKCRRKLNELFLKMHTMSVAESADFLENCIVVRSAV